MWNTYFICKHPSIGQNNVQWNLSHLLAKTEIHQGDTHWIIHIQHEHSHWTLNIEYVNRIYTLDPTLLWKNRYVLNKQMKQWHFKSKSVSVEKSKAVFIGIPSEPLNKKERAVEFVYFNLHLILITIMLFFALQRRFHITKIIEIIDMLQL